LELKLIIELDGSQHREQANKDIERTLFLNQRGFKVVRFWNNDLYNNLEGTLESIHLAIEEQEALLKT
jgi:crossover junction endodeoxyribonuclease RuvC